MLRIDLEPGETGRQQLPGDYNAFLVVLAGEGQIGAEQPAAAVRSGQVAWLTRADGDRPSEVQIAAADNQAFSALLFGGPLNEPVVAHGPFVMNTDAQIREAYSDYRAGRFGELHKV